MSGRGLLYVLGFCAVGLLFKFANNHTAAAVFAAAMWLVVYMEGRNA